MASTFTRITPLSGGLGERVVLLTGNLGVYATNGVAVTPNQLGMGRIDGMIITPQAGGAGFQFSWDQANSKIKAHWGDNANGAAAAGIEVTNATDLTTKTFTVLAFGV